MKADLQIRGMENSFKNYSYIFSLLPDILGKLSVVVRHLG